MSTLRTVEPSQSVNRVRRRHFIPADSFIDNDSLPGSNPKAVHPTLEYSGLRHDSSFAGGAENEFPAQVTKEAKGPQFIAHRYAARTWPEPPFSDTLRSPRENDSIEDRRGGPGSGDLHRPDDGATLFPGRPKIQLLILAQARRIWTGYGTQGPRLARSPDASSIKFETKLNRQGLRGLWGVMALALSARRQSHPISRTSKYGAFEVTMSGDMSESSHRSPTLY
ncbi:hypothetical protein DFP72DRAFT_849578 [Ephemerocybe angulata]|uniref:Uncharacterized protein n=1 Tax=Ephemerocybe angulata TaxID=980116 RepID=A0A8H6HUE4_9AGAR|nr:hypothetical protein DFP72DRAFT_849578 [Tulosesus angulatus]